MNPPSVTEASYKCTVRHNVIRICRNLPDGIHATREPCENRKRVSVRRAIPGKRKHLRSFPCKLDEFRMLRMSINLVSYNASRNLISIIAHTEITTWILKDDGSFVRLAYDPEKFSKCFRSIRHRFASTHAAVVFFQMVKLQYGAKELQQVEKSRSQLF